MGVLSMAPTTLRYSLSLRQLPRTFPKLLRALLRASVTASLRAFSILSACNHSKCGFYFENKWSLIVLYTFDLIPSLTPYPMSSWNTPSLSWTLTIAETPTKYLPWKCHAIKNNDLDRPTHLTVVHKVDGLLWDWVAPSVVTEYLICQTDRPVTLEVRCMLASTNWPLKISF